MKRRDCISGPDLVTHLLEKVADLGRELLTARADALILAHSYQHDSRPPDDVVKRALSYRQRVTKNVIAALDGEW
jgi:hypothetical protein